MSARDPLVAAERAVAAAVEKDQAASAEVERTAMAASRASAEYLADDAALPKKIEADARAEKARTLASQARAAATMATEKRDAIVRERETTRLEQERRSVPEAWQAALTELGAQLVTLDRGADALLLAVERVVQASRKTWAESAARARGLGLAWEVPEPTVGDALLGMQVQATEAREAETRECCADVFDPPVGHGDWRIDPGLNARQRAELARDQSRARAAEQDIRASIVTVQTVNAVVAALGAKGAGT